MLVNNCFLNIKTMNAIIANSTATNSKLFKNHIYLQITFTMAISAKKSDTEKMKNTKRIDKISLMMIDKFSTHNNFTSSIFSLP